MNEFRKAYFDALGDRDPVAVQRETADAWEALLASRPDAATPGEWTIVELFGHVLDAELVAATRYRFVLAQPGAHLPGYDQDAWVATQRHADRDPKELLARFRMLRDENIRLWEAASEDERAREGVHGERGPSTFTDLFREIAGHDVVHLEQARAM